MTVGAVFTTMFRREATKHVTRRAAAGNAAGSNPVTSGGSNNKMSSLSSPSSQTSQKVPDKSQNISSMPLRDLDGWVHEEWEYRFFFP